MVDIGTGYIHPTTLNVFIIAQFLCELHKVKLVKCRTSVITSVMMILNFPFLVIHVFVFGSILLTSKDNKISNKLHCCKAQV